MSKSFFFCFAIVTISAFTSLHADDAIKMKILELLPQADANGDGVISDAEEVAVWRQVLKRRPQIDRDGNGTLSDSEKQGLLRMAGRRAKPKPATPMSEVQSEAGDLAKASSIASTDSIFSTKEILDETTLETRILQDWHSVGATRQKLIEINVADWWPGQDYRIPVRLIMPLEGKSQGFHITGTEELESLSKDFKPNAFEAKLLANGVSLVMTGIKALNTIPGKQALKQ